MELYVIYKNVAYFWLINIRNGEGYEYKDENY